ncbi:hypothetical protein OIU77_007475 [Salix suchowensis]|uniref:UBL3-like ubiquitin domain-containing protein n=1 Tax=Salix suchowensis TaxID=1278906 RepID=A0ABQ9AG92_9ROSI|nr:hypothetical protein OIU77_007475 [Salix suchowensis]
MPEEDLVDIKFRLYDGSDIGPFRCSSSTSTVDMLKQRVVSDWPRGKTITPKVVNEIKLISSGKILYSDVHMVITVVLLEILGEVYPWYQHLGEDSYQ